MKVKYRKNNNKDDDEEEEGYDEVEGNSIIVGYLVIIVIFIVIFVSLAIYFYVFKDNVILRSYYLLQYQSYNAYINDVNYYKIFYNIFFILIIVIIGTVLYWDIVYKTAKKTSKCYEISKIIEDNANNKTPFLYTFIIFNNDNIDKSVSKYFLKIIYDFKKMKTTIDYGNDDGNDNDLIANYKPNDISSQQLIGELNKISDTPQAIEYKVNNVNTRYKKFYYFDLKMMKSSYIDNINVDVLNSDIYRYLSIDANNKVVKNYSSNTLLKFTKEYSMNENYNTSIVYDILFAKKNIDKLSL